MKLHDLLQQVRVHVKGFPEPLSQHMVARYGNDPYLVLISCLLSLRAQDRVTIHVCHDLFAHVRTPKEMVALDRDELEALIYKSGFYKNKAKVLLRVSQELLDRHGGMVPRSSEELRALYGVGLKTANLVRGVAFGEDAICVDTHVHRISNMLGLVSTKDADKTEEALRTVLPKKNWTEWNYLCVLIGQNSCLSKRGCSNKPCPIKKLFAEFSSQH